MNVLGILGSPRSGGNADLLLDQALAGAAEAGAAVKKIELGRCDISGCIECNDCLDTGECSIADGMDAIYRSLEWADRIILASPMFFMGLPAQVKAAIDRCQRYWALKYVLRQPFPRRQGAPPRYGVFIGVGATKGERLFEGTLLTLKYFFDAISVTPQDDLNLLIRGVEAKGEIARDAAAMSAAFELGRELAGLA